MLVNMKPKLKKMNSRRKCITKICNEKCVPKLQKKNIRRALRAHEMNVECESVRG